MMLLTHLFQEQKIHVRVPRFTKLG